MNEISFSYEKMGTKTRFEEEAKGNSEMAYFKLRFILSLKRFGFRDLLTTGVFKNPPLGWYRYFLETYFEKKEERRKWNSSTRPRGGIREEIKSMYVCMYVRENECTLFK